MNKVIEKIKTFEFKKLHIKLNRHTFKNTLFTIWEVLTFGILLGVFIFKRLFHWIVNSRIWPKKIIRVPEDRIDRYYEKIVRALDKHKDSNSINRIELMDIAIRNMEMKKTRSVVTIGGMAVGIGAIVFLVSIGYGLQDLVISRVARLEEMQQVDVHPQAGSRLKIDEEILNSLLKIKNVDKALPLIGVVAKVSYKLSVSDMPAYGVTADYLKRSAIKPVRGKIFASNHIKSSSENAKDVLGAVSEEQEIRNSPYPVAYNIHPNKWVRVRAKSSTYGAVYGYTRRIPGINYGKRIIGGWYYGAEEIGVGDDGGERGWWIQAEVPLWEKTTCEEIDNDCEGKTYKIMRDDFGNQIIKTGYFAEISVSVRDVEMDDVLALYDSQKVLGTASASLNSATSSSVLNLDIDALIASEAGIIEEKKTKQVALGSDAQKKAIVNRAMLKVLGIPEEKAINKTFSASFIVVGDLTKKGEKLQSVEDKYTIVGVVPDEKSPFFYVPFIDLRSIGIDNFSQVKVVAGNKETVPEIRDQIEAMGFSTASVIDTVTQINSLFSTARFFLALLGTVALAVAALGMFNTLTVSLLERTHEVGLMKAMGMKSQEVQELFLTESMVMGFAGGFAGLLLGFIGGKVAGLSLSVFSIVKGIGLIDISSIPLMFVLLILVLSLIVGVVTGIYPARRAKKISALDALRYE